MAFLPERQYTSPPWIYVSWQHYSLIKQYTNTTFTYNCPLHNVQFSRNCLYRIFLTLFTIIRWPHTSEMMKQAQIIILHLLKNGTIFLNYGSMLQKWHHTLYTSRKTATQTLQIVLNCNIIKVPKFFYMTLYVTMFQNQAVKINTKENTQSEFLIIRLFW